MLYFVILLATAILIYYKYVKFQRRNWPPGPFPYPLIGNMVEILMADAGKPCFAFEKIAKKYGNIFTIKTGVVDNIVVNGFKEIKETEAMDEILDRIDDEWLLDRTYGSVDYGLFFSSSTFWKNNRLYTHTITHTNRLYTQRTLKDFGFGKLKSMNDLIQEEFEELVRRLKDRVSKSNGTLRVDLTFNAAFVNIIYCFLTGVRFDQDDPQLVKLVLLANDWFTCSNSGSSILGAYPGLKDWAPGISGFAKAHNANVNMLKYFTDLVNSYRKKGGYKTSPSNFIEAALQRIDNGAQHSDYDEPIFTDKNLICLLNDLFGAGSETSANSTAFAVRYMVQNPLIQKKMQDEVDRVVGRDRCVTLEDKQKLTYVEAFTLEVLRVDPVAPVVPRKTLTKCKVGGYEVPAKMNVLVNLHSGNMEKQVWGDPEAFRPERFINENGEIYNAKKLCSFSFGKRDCIGQSVAKSTLFMAAASFAQNFTFLPDPKNGMPNDKVITGFTTCPIPFDVLVQIR